MKISQLKSYLKMNAKPFYRAVYLGENCWKLEISLSEGYFDGSVLETAAGETREFKDIETVFKTVYKLHADAKMDDDSNPMIDLISAMRLALNKEKEVNARNRQD